jgi:hypothetical protein
MDCEARAGQGPVKLLAPNSLGFLVNWANRGNYLNSMIRGLKERGACEASYVPNLHSRDPASFKSGWEENALEHRLGEAWDLDNSSKRMMVKHAITMLCAGCPLYVAYNWWGHALMITGVIWDESLPYNVKWVLRNSHNESNVITMSGDRGVPSEAYGFRSPRSLAA